jgi:hypothetical protein
MKLLKTMILLEAVVLIDGMAFFQQENEGYANKFCPILLKIMIF